MIVYMKLSIDSVDSFLSYLFGNKRLSVLLTMFLVFYGGMAGPNLPISIEKLFTNPVFRVFILSLIVYKANNDPPLSIMIASSFIIIMDLVNKKKLFESFTSIDSLGFEGFGSHSDEMNPLDFLEGKKNIKSSLSLCSLSKSLSVSNKVNKWVMNNYNTIQTSKKDEDKEFYISNQSDIKAIFRKSDAENTDEKNKILFELRDQASIILPVKESYQVYLLNFKGSSPMKDEHRMDFENFVKNLDKILGEEDTGYPEEVENAILKSFETSKKYFCGISEGFAEEDMNPMDSDAEMEDVSEENDIPIESDDEPSKTDFNDSLKELLKTDLVDGCGLGDEDATKVIEAISGAVSEEKESLGDDDLLFLPEGSDLECINQKITDLAIFGVDGDEDVSDLMPDEAEIEEAEPEEIEIVDGAEVDVEGFAPYN